MKKRVCTITHNTVPNYGAVLQAYALQRAIQNVGCENEVLNYDEERVRRVYHYSLFSQRSLKEIIKHILYFKRYKKKIRVFSQFSNQYIKLSKRYTNKTISEANQKYDLFITGSDQVWSLPLHQGDTAYLLGFVDDNNKKGSYAASFGHEDISMIPKQYYDTYRELLSEFKYVNVREKDGVDLFEKFTNKKRVAAQVVDPTFLLETDEWTKIESEPQYDNYILLYCVNRYEELLDYAKQLSNATGKQIINIQDGGQILRGVINVDSVSVNTFIGLIHHADYVMTNSFHGMAFSIIFHKQFVFDYVHSKVNSNSRVTSLMETVRLENRELSKVNIEQSIDYSEVDILLSKQVEFSYTRLEEMLKGE